jgi:hypothetical protein
MYVIRYFWANTTPKLCLPQQTCSPRKGAIVQKGVNLRPRVVNATTTVLLTYKTSDPTTQCVKLQCCWCCSAALLLSLQRLANRPGTNKHISLQRLTN